LKTSCANLVDEMAKVQIDPKLSSMMSPYVFDNLYIIGMGTCLREEDFQLLAKLGMALVLFLTMCDMSDIWQGNGNKQIKLMQLQSTLTDLMWWLDPTPQQCCPWCVFVLTIEFWWIIRSMISLVWLYICKISRSLQSSALIWECGLNIFHTKTWTLKNELGRHERQNTIALDRGFPLKDFTYRFHY